MVVVRAMAVAMAIDFDGIRFMGMRRVRRMIVTVIYGLGYWDLTHVVMPVIETKSWFTFGSVIYMALISDEAMGLTRMLIAVHLHQKE